MILRPMAHHGICHAGSIIHHKKGGCNGGLTTCYVFFCSAVWERLTHVIHPCHNHRCSEALRHRADDAFHYYSPSLIVLFDICAFVFAVHPRVKSIEKRYFVLTIDFRFTTEQGSFIAVDGGAGAPARLYAFIFLYSFPAMNTITAVHTPAQTSTVHSGTAPL